MRQILAVGLLLLIGCTPTYQVREATDQFADPAKPATYMTKGNLIQIATGTFVPWPDEMNAYVDRDRATGKVVDVGFSVALSANAWDRMIIVRGDELTFLADGERINTTALFGRVDYGVDTAVYSVTPAQFKKIAFANSLEFKVNGRKASRSYPARNFKLLDSFRENLRRFYNEQIGPFL